MYSGPDMSDLGSHRDESERPYSLRSSYNDDDGDDDEEAIAAVRSSLLQPHMSHSGRGAGAAAMNAGFDMPATTRPGYEPSNALLLESISKRPRLGGPGVPRLAADASGRDRQHTDSPQVTLDDLHRQ